MFADAWAGHDSNDPVFDPNSNDYNPNVFDPNHIDYISSEQIEKWDPFYNFDAAGDSQYAIDVADFAVFLDNWLWEACWHGNYSEVMYAMSGGSESMMMAMPVFMSTSAIIQPQEVEEISIAEQILKLEDCVVFLETMWLEDAYFQQEIDSDDWDEFMDATYENLSDLEKLRKLLDKKQ